MSFLGKRFADLISLHAALAFYPAKVSRGLDSVVRVKPIWSSNNRANILTCLVDRPVYQPLKRLMHILNVGLQQRRAAICSDGALEAFIQISITIYPVRHPRFALFSV